MDAERLRTFLLTLPHAVETMQWGASLLFWVGDKAIGGKMFCVISLDEASIGKGRSVISYPAGPERYPDLLELEGLFPAPYLARIHWVAAENWQVFRNPQWEAELRAAHAITFAKLPPRTRAVLAMPAAAQRRLIAENRKLLGARATTKTAATSPSSRQIAREKQASTPESGRSPARSQRRQLQSPIDET